MSTIAQQIGPLKISSPIMVASGPLSDSPDLIRRAEDCGAGCVSTKLTMLTQPVQGYRRMYAVRGMYSFNPSDRRNCLEQGTELVYNTKKATTLPVFANIAGPGDDLEGWCRLARSMEEAGADALELNFVCPNMAFSREACGEGQLTGAQIGQHPEIISRIAAAVKAHVGIPVWVKATANNVNHLNTARALAKTDIDGIVVMGTQIAVPPIDIYQGGRTCMPNLGNNALGGLVGPVNRLYANRLIANTAMNTALRIAGGRGITEWAHVVEAIMFGASITPMCTKLLWDGFEVIRKMNQGLLRFMEEQGYETIDAMRGLALRHLVAPDRLEAYDVPPHFDRERCVGCGACLRIASCTALSFDKEQNVQVDVDKCVFCGLCGSLCPRRAISFPREKTTQKGAV